VDRRVMIQSYRRGAGIIHCKKEDGVINNAANIYAS